MDEDEHEVDIKEVGTLSEDDTKKSFDFTGELRGLNELIWRVRSPELHRAAQTAFRTPAKINLRYEFKDLPPVPKLPTLQDELSRLGECLFNLPIDVNSEPSLLPGSDSLVMMASDEELPNNVGPQVIPCMTSVASQPSNGELNRNFKLGGKHSLSNKKESPSLTLSDIIPLPDIARSLPRAPFSGDESSLMTSILAHAIEIKSPPDRRQPESDSTSKREVRDLACSVSGHQRNSSALSFEGFDFFAEVRRGFEFNDSRPGFYPPAAIASDRRHLLLLHRASLAVHTDGQFTYGDCASYDSVFGGRYEFQKTDSLFEKTGCRNSVCSSDSTFFGKDAVSAATKPRYHPISSLSIPSVHSPPKEDDTMISVRPTSKFGLMSNIQSDAGWWSYTPSFCNIYDRCFPMYTSRATQEYCH